MIGQVFTRYGGMGFFGFCRGARNFSGTSDRVQRKIRSGKGEGTITLSASSDQVEFTLANQRHSNAISNMMLLTMVTHLRNFSSTGRVSIKFATEGLRWSSAGFNYHDFDLGSIEKGLSPFYDEDPTCEVLSLLRRPGFNSEMIVEKSLVGYGIVLASACKEIVMLDPARTTIFLPHFRLGVSFPYSAMASLVSHYGYLLSTEMFLVDRGIPAREFIEKIERNKALSPGEEQNDLEKSIDLLKRAGSGSFFHFNDHHQKVLDRTGCLEKLARLHAEQFRAIHRYGELEKLPLDVYKRLESIRTETTGVGVSRSLMNHVAGPKELNETPYRDAMKQESVCLDERRAPVKKFV